MGGYEWFWDIKSPIPYVYEFGGRGSFGDILICTKFKKLYFAM